MNFYSPLDHLPVNTIVTEVRDKVNILAIKKAKADKVHRVSEAVSD